MTSSISSTDCDCSDDRAKLEEIFDSVCLKAHIAKRSAAADEIARRMMLLYRAGVRDSSVYFAIADPTSHRRHTDSRLDSAHKRGSILH